MIRHRSSRAITCSDTAGGEGVGAELPNNLAPPAHRGDALPRRVQPDHPPAWWPDVGRQRS